MFTFAIVSSNAWVQQCKTSSAGRKSLAKHAGQKFLTNPDAWEKLAIIREVIWRLGIIGNPIIGKNRE
jgi:hypothetical protein